jgi:hypothetical protein
MKRLPFLTLLATFMLSNGGLNAAALQAPAEAVRALKLEDLTRELGPFAVRDKLFTIVLHQKHLVDSTSGDPDMVSTLVGMEIKDAEGTVHFRETFPYEVSGGEFSESLSASVELLQGKERNGLLVTFGSLPSTPLGGESWQVFGMFDNQLVPFSKPIFTEGQLTDPGDGSVVKTAPEAGLLGEVLNFRIWTGNFFVIYPVKIDFVMAKAMPAWRCLKLTPQGQVPWCQYRVETDRKEPDEDETFVRLHAESSEEMGNAQHVVVKKSSNVDFLAAEGDVEWQEDDRGVSLSPGNDFWLKVRIDNKQGWIHTQEDFEAIGLPQAG